MDRFNRIPTYILNHCNSVLRNTDNNKKKTIIMLIYEEKKPLA